MWTLVVPARNPGPEAVLVAMGDSPSPTALESISFSFNISEKIWGVGGMKLALLPCWSPHPVLKQATPSPGHEGQGGLARGLPGRAGGLS